MALHDETTGRTATSHRNGMKFFVVVAAVVALAAIAWAAGLFTVEADGKLAAPEVDVSGGSVPEVDVNTADIDVGTRSEVIEVPTVDVTPADER